LIVTGVQTCALPIYLEQGRARLQELLVLLGVAEADGEQLLHRRPVWRDRLEQRYQVRRADDVDGALEEVGREGRAHQRGVAAVRSEERRVGKEWRGG